MSIHYQLGVVNQSGRDQSYAFFFAPQMVEAPTPAMSVAWATGFVPQGGQMMLQTDNQYFGFSGVVEGPPNPGRPVMLTTSQPVTLGSNTAPGTSLTMSAEGSEPFLNQGPPSQTIPGGFTISTSTDFNTDNDFQIGCAKNSPNGEIMPIFTLSAEPGTVNQIVPVMKIYVAAANFQPGEIIDFEQLVYQSGSADFARPGFTNAIITQNADGSWNTRYNH